MENTSLNRVVGIDIAQSFIDVCDAGRVQRLVYDTACVRGLIQGWETDRPDLVVCEATGGLERALVAQLAGKFIRGRLVDLAHLVEVLDGDKEIIRFEVTKGENEMLEARFDARGQLQGQRLLRPPMPGSGYEYWPFDGEYWPDEIGYYEVTLKDACPARREQ